MLYETDELPAELGRLCFSYNSLTSLQVVRVRLVGGKIGALC